MKRAFLTLAALLLAAPATAQQATRQLTEAELLAVADSGHALAMAEACGTWGDAAWFAEVRRRIHLLAALGTTGSRDARLLFLGAWLMAERRGQADAALLGPPACLGVERSEARRAYQNTLEDTRLDGHAIPPASHD